MAWVFEINDPEYVRICMEKTYMEMDEDELEYIKEKEAEYYVPRIKEMLNNGTPEFEVYAHVMDLYMDYEIADDDYILDAAGIFDKFCRSYNAYDKAKEFYMADGYVNPLKGEN